MIPMPLVDLPLEQLKTYMGRNPRPADFSEYWENSLAEVDQLQSKFDFQEVECPIPDAQWFEARFEGVGGATIFAKHVRPRSLSQPRPCVLQFHGYQMDSGDWAEISRWLLLGYSAFAMDVRGQGGQSSDPGGAAGSTVKGHITRGLGDSPEKLFYRGVYCDCAQIAKLAMGLDFVDAGRVGTIGASQGGALSLVCAALEPRIARCVSAYPYLADYKRVWEMDLAKDAYDDLRYWIRSFDPQHARIDEIWEKLGYIDIQHLADRIQGKVQLFTGLMDTICPPSSQFAAFNKMSCPKELELYPNHGHEGLPHYGTKSLGFLAKL